MTGPQEQALHALLEDAIAACQRNGDIAADADPREQVGQHSGPPINGIFDENAIAASSRCANALTGDGPNVRPELAGRHLLVAGNGPAGAALAQRHGGDSRVEPAESATVLDAAAEEAVHTGSGGHLHWPARGGEVRSPGS